MINKILVMMSIFIIILICIELIDFELEKKWYLSILSICILVI